MAAITNIVIADNTPTNHTFYPIGRKEQALKLVNRESVSQAGNMALTLDLRLAQASQKVNRVAWNFVHPFEITANGVTTVRDFAQAKSDFILPTGMTAADLLRFATMYKNVAAHAVVMAYLSLDPMVG